MDYVTFMKKANEQVEKMGAKEREAFLLNLLRQIPPTKFEKVLVLLGERNSGYKEQYQSYIA